MFWRRALAACLAVLAPLALLGCARSAGNDGDWTMGGRDQSGAYYSPLTAIDAGNVGRLGYAWSYDMGTTRGQEATPLVVDGVMYTSGIWGHVYALDAKTGALKWHYDPQVPGQNGRYACCDIVNRGVAYRDGVVFVASEDGRLHAIDAATGKAKWVADTIIDHKQPYASTGAPVLTRDSVIIGNAGADMGDGGLRGYISAWDIKTGAFKWRFFTVPPAPGKPFENPELAMAAKSWGGNLTGKYQGGGTVWDGMSYDADTGLVIFGTANAAPYIQSERTNGRTDDLFNASIVAVHADSGKMAWYYQETPGDQWDFDAVQKFVFADLTIAGAPHKVVMQASKNGYFYVLDRATGKLLSANLYSYANWTKGMGPDGRPIYADNIDYSHTPRNIYPGWPGAHTWNPMSFSPKTGLVYIPTIDASNIWIALKTNGGSIKHFEGFFSTGGFIPDDTYDPKSVARVYGTLPSLKVLAAERKGTRLSREILKAWDPVKRQVVWQHVTSEGDRGYDGGVLSTAGNLVFQGRGDGHLYVYDASTGAQLASIDTGSHIMAAPMAYLVDGEEYIAVQAGYGGSGIGYPIPPGSAAFNHVNANRIIVFKLGGGAVPKPPVLPPEPYPAPPPSTASLAMIQHGEDKFNEQCARCHVFGRNITPDLSKLPMGIHQVFDDIPLKGMLAPAGMPNLSDALTKADVDAIHAYLIDQERRGYEAQQKTKGAKPQ